MKVMTEEKAMQLPVLDEFLVCEILLSRQLKGMTGNFQLATLQ